MTGSSKESTLGILRIVLHGGWNYQQIADWLNENDYGAEFGLI